MTDMRIWLFIAALALLGYGKANAEEPCEPGVYLGTEGDFVVLTRRADTGVASLRYLMRDGRRGGVADPASPVFCRPDAVEMRTSDRRERWERFALTETPTQFESAATILSGVLIEPSGRRDTRLPLVVLVHGSERSAAIGGAYGYALAAQGLMVFVYDKRGTGASSGEYTQNFELLAADASAALHEARRLGEGRFGRAGFFGGSQGGWVAPLAAVRGGGDFVAVGFGLIASPITEDREQMETEVLALGLGDEALAKVGRLSDATATLLRSGFSDGYRALGASRRELSTDPWSQDLEGEHSGAILRTSDEELRLLGGARFDNLELIWDYDALSILRQLDVPLLWVLAEEDREAPIGTTRTALLSLAGERRPVDAFLFPNTGHGMMEFTTNAAGLRSPTRITDGYLRLLGDWIRGDLHGRYGSAARLTELFPATGDAP